MSPLYFQEFYARIAGLCFSVIVCCCCYDLHEMILPTYLDGLKKKKKKTQP